MSEPRSPLQCAIEVAKSPWLYTAADLRRAERVLIQHGCRGYARGLAKLGNDADQLLLPLGARAGSGFGRLTK